jgi:hypothetical protein
MALLMDDDGFVAALEEMTDPAVSTVVGLGIGAVELPHAAGEVAVECFDHDVVVLSMRQ